MARTRRAVGSAHHYPSSCGAPLSDRLRTNLATAFAAAEFSSPTQLTGGVFSGAGDGRARAEVLVGVRPADSMTLCSAAALGRRSPCFSDFGILMPPCCCFCSAAAAVVVAARPAAL